MDLFVGLDVSLNSVSVCILQTDGRVVWQGKTLSEPPALITVIEPHPGRNQVDRPGGLPAVGVAIWRVVRMRLPDGVH
jgi:hypothetical protein